MSAAFSKHQTPVGQGAAVHRAEAASASRPSERRRRLALVAALLAWLGGACAQARPLPGERVVHHEVSAWGEIWVVEDAGTRYLRFGRDGVDQSAVRLGDPLHLEFTYTRAILSAFAVAPPDPRVLIVGLGGGTLPMFLRRVAPRAVIDVVELDPRVAAVAASHLGFTPDDGVRVHLGDGRRFIEASGATWDVIVLDAYGPDNIPTALATREFLVAVRARLAPGGLVAANVWSEAVNARYPAMLRTYEDVFPEVHVVRGLTGASRIVIAPEAATRWDRAHFEEAAARLAARWRLGFDLRAIVERGYEPPGGHPAGGAVLRDPRP